MNIETKFDLGQKVWKIRRERRKEWEPCAFCGGEGRITGKNNKDRYCPACIGHRGKDIYKDMAWSVVEESMTVGEVKIRRSLRKESDEEQYMCWETGVGSGTLHDADDLFASFDKAETEAEIRNGELT
jgi:hypothetical protein